jgi:hypothetical protein
MVEGDSWRVATDQEADMTVEAPASAGTLDADREALRTRLHREFHVAALFVPVKTVASVLCLSSSSSYAYIRTGTFFLPIARFTRPLWWR